MEGLVVFGFLLDDAELMAVLTSSLEVMEEVAVVHHIMLLEELVINSVEGEALMEAMVDYGAEGEEELIMEVMAEILLYLHYH